MSDNQNKSTGAARQVARPQAEPKNVGRVEKPGEGRLTSHREALREALLRIPEES